VFLSSHILGDIERVCDTLAIIHEGQLLLVTGRDELLAQYATNVIALRPDPISADHIEPLVQALQAQDWVANVTRTDDEWHVAVTDMTVGKQRILPLVVTHNVVLTRFEWKRPSLEEIFLTLSSHGAETTVLENNTP